MWKVLYILVFVLLPLRTVAQCVSTNDIKKCARLPDGIRISYHMLQDGNSTADGTWSILLYDHQSSYTEIADTHQIPISGTATTDFPNVNCTITSPFYADAVCVMGALAPGGVSAAQVCADWSCDMGAEIQASALPNDECPDGFYTVSYDVSCGDGLIDVANIPQCSTDTSGEYCLIGTGPIAPCGAGITELRTNTGLSFPIWATKNTSPALHISHNGTMCYVNLGPGKSPNAININIDGIIYHTMD